MAYELPEQAGGLNLSATPDGPPPPVPVSPLTTLPEPTQPPMPLIGKIGTVLEAFGSGFKGQEPLFLKLRRQQAVEDQLKAEQAFKFQQAKVQQAHQDWTETGMLMDKLKDDPKAGMNILQQRARNGSQAAKVMLMSGVGTKDFAEISHLEPIIRELDPEGYGEVQQAIRSGTVDQLDPLRLRGMKERAIEEVKRRDVVTAETREFARLNSKPVDSMSDADILRYEELRTKREEIDQKRRDLKLARMKTERTLEVASPPAPPAVPVGTATAPAGISQGARDMALGVASPEAQTQAAQKDTQELTAMMEAAGISPQSKEGQSLLRIAVERKAKGTPLVQLDMGQDASKEAQKKFMDKASETYQQLKTAPVQLKNLEQAKALIPKARGFMGPFGETKLEVVKFLNNNLGMNIDQKGINSAEELRTRIFQNVLENLKKMDAQPSQYQQIIMMESLGKLGSDPNALVGMVDAYAGIIRGRVDLYNQEVASAEKRGVKFPYDPIIKLDVPQPKPLPKPDINAKFKQLGALVK